MKKLTFIFFLTTLFACSQEKNNISTSLPLELWYTQPATRWVEALPVGNGRMGAMVFGDATKERIQLNEESLWGGIPLNDNNPNALENLEEVRKMLFEDKNKAAYDLATETLLATPSSVRSYQTLADLNIGFETRHEINNYKRSLDLKTGIATTIYEKNGHSIKQEVFASAVDDVVVYHLEVDGKGVNLSLDLSRTDARNLVHYGDNEIYLSSEGQIFNENDPRRGAASVGMKYATLAKVIADHSSVTLPDTTNSIGLNGLTEVTILITGATQYDFASLGIDTTIEPLKVCEEHFGNLKYTDFNTLKNRHIADHQSMMNRVVLDLGDSELDSLPTDKRLERVKNGATDDGLVALYFQYGRYLLMGASRNPGRLPANLQGVWNEHINAPWGSDYHTNINLQMNYWHAEMCNLSETTLPLIDFIDKIRANGRITAKSTYGAKGWTMHHNTDIFGKTALHDGIHWGTSPLAGTWMTFPIYRHFEYTQDKDYLKNKAYPIMKENAEFILDFLVEYEGYLVTSPSFSPENSYLHPVTNTPTQLTYAATIDIQIIREHFTNCIEAARILNTDDDFIKLLEQVMTALPPIQVGKDGTLQEWIKDYKEAEPGHRHISHLLSLHPGRLITENEEELFEAAKKTIAKRLANGGGHTGWSRAWIINFYARLYEGDSAYYHTYELFRKSTLPNLFDTHPPFQIDGNYGGTSGIAEMLLQSHTGTILLLPALPSAWKNGSIAGLKVKGGHEVAMFWKDGKLDYATIIPFDNGVLKIEYNGKKVERKGKKGEEIVIDDL